MLPIFLLRQSESSLTTQAMRAKVATTPRRSSHETRLSAGDDLVRFGLVGVL